ncbi:Brp/Blh family beta-carotene 15,15'-dioxygenase [Halpernia frigidisoli]|uniref:Probable beta-carotene 15,15'-dioxygenase n=1 Tax=Halpernia frigidisoli TaxID=1125876 RepID=A0A1I3IKW2_9FLAO|nr:Brp/Blh family beta-carotene 15,15'-dioxygenase [Halpernia frigidisoli]SFI48413.1 beta-carotene 15,15'-monooxygenase, Brp/Blh family [Halpernia frigidisoli]
MKNQNFKVVISFFCIWLTNFFSKEVQFVSSFILILSFGILHGANDLFLLNKIKNKKKQSVIVLLIKYVSVVLSVVILFYFIPKLALLSFILISAFHFGEQHWTNKLHIKSDFIKKTFVFFYGFFILFLLFFFHQNDVRDIVFTIIDYKISKSVIEIPFYISTLMLFLTGTYMFFKNSTFKAKLVLELFFLIVFAVIFKTAALLWGFAIYFIFWHSIPSMIDQVQYLYGSWNKNNFIKYCKSALWFWLISIVGIAILYFVFKDEKLFEAMFFAFLAAITVPHVWVIISMFGTKKEIED